MSPVPWNCGATARRACRGPSVFGPPQLRLVAPLQPVAEGDRVPVVDQPAPAAVAVGHVRAEPAAQPPAVVEDLDLSWRVDVLRAVHARPYDVSRRKAPDSRTDRPLPCEPEIVTSQGDRSVMSEGTEQPTVVAIEKPRRRWLLPTLVGIGAFMLGLERGHGQHGRGPQDGC